MCRCSVKRQVRRRETPGHIGGISTRDLLRSIENCRDLSHRSSGMRDAFIEIRSTMSQDPVYRPTRPLSEPQNLFHPHAVCYQTGHLRIDSDQPQGEHQARIFT
jgi:hypothetical protein